MTKLEKYLLLKLRGEKMLEKVIRGLNQNMEFSFQEVTPNLPNYRTQQSLNEICVALALWEEQKEALEKEGELI